MYAQFLTPLAVAARTFLATPSRQQPIQTPVSVMRPQSLYRILYLARRSGKLNASVLYGIHADNTSVSYAALSLIITDRSLSKTCKHEFESISRATACQLSLSSRKSLLNAEQRKLYRFPLDVC